MNYPYILPRNIEALADAEFVALCEEPDFLFERTPLELEQTVRLGAALEVHSAIENELQAEIHRLSQYEPQHVTKARQRAAQVALDALIIEAEKMPKANIRVAG